VGRHFFLTVALRYGNVNSRISLSKAALAQAVAVLEKDLRVKLRGNLFETEELRAMVLGVIGAVTTVATASANQPWQTFDPRRAARQAVTDAVESALVAADDGGARSVADYAAYVVKAVSGLDDAGS
jgi:hypothetical protein